MSSHKLLNTIDYIHTLTVCSVPVADALRADRLAKLALNLKRTPKKPLSYENDDGDDDDDDDDDYDDNDDDDDYDDDAAAAAAAADDDDDADAAPADDADYAQYHERK
ncbi:hypothetical protein DPMN_060977 [Dreissena polymorpha]|uniref:Uncharacterized protein n=1 Tax=Dreissena polymorpha TaxID=45954 RepID=A0A9D4C665_DREPO|nr:hypothetical protein DPMN_060977 [Dreissena polymorpha]